MTIYWRRGSLPELKGMTRDDRKRVWRRARMKAIVKGRLAFFHFTALAFTFATCYPILRYTPFNGIESRSARLALYFGWFAAQIAYHFLIHIPWECKIVRPYLRECLASGTWDKPR